MYIKELRIYHQLSCNVRSKTWLQAEDALVLILYRNRLLIYVHQRIADLSPTVLQCTFKNMASSSLILHRGGFSINILQKQTSDMSSSKGSFNAALSFTGDAVVAALQRNGLLMYIHHRIVYLSSTILQCIFQMVAQCRLIIYRGCFSSHIIQKQTSDTCTSKNCGSITNCPAMFFQKSSYDEALSFMGEALVAILNKIDC